MSEVPARETCQADFCAGDNVQHFRELPKFGHLGYGQPIFKQYNPVTDMYEYCGGKAEMTGSWGLASGHLWLWCRHVEVCWRRSIGGTTRLAE